MKSARTKNSDNWETDFWDLTTFDPYNLDQIQIGRISNDVGSQKSGSQKSGSQLSDLLIDLISIGGPQLSQSRIFNPKIEIPLVLSEIYVCSSVTFPRHQALPRVYQVLLSILGKKWTNFDEPFEKESWKEKRKSR